MNIHLPFADIHCHLVPGIDDGSKSPEESLEMAKIASREGIETVICTPHQLGNYSANTGDLIRQRVAALQQLLDSEGIHLRVLPGADVRIEDTMFDGLRDGSVLSLGDHRQHVLLELPHELYLPIIPILERLSSLGMDSILSHPERNQGILREPHHVVELVQNGCLMQVTTASLVGSFGPTCQQFSEWMLTNGLVHFMATDAHGPQARRPLMRRCYERVRELVGAATAEAICCVHPAAVVEGRQFHAPRPARRPTSPAGSGRRSGWFGLRKSA
jgi:protein-tyrosine phosphatase